MDYGHPLQFGTFVTPRNDDPQAPVELAVLSEELGYDLVTFQDHPYQPAFLDTWTLMSWVAGRTSSIHIAPDVLNVPMRPPAVTARAAASLDHLSGGRFQLGLGAGAFWDAMEAMGAERLTPGESVDALAEAVAIIRGVWDAADPTPLVVDGRHHRADGAQRGPAPAHSIPIWIGAHGPRMLRLIGRSADGWWPSLGRVGAADLAAGQAVIDDAATAAGRDPREIRRLLNISGEFSSGSAGSRALLHGTAEQWVADLLPLAVDTGVSTFVLASDDPATLRRFAEEVAPALRDAVARERRARGTVEGLVRSAGVRSARRPGIDYDAIPAELLDHVVEPGDVGYASVRSTYLRGGAPGLVIQPADVDQVRAALAFARSQPVPLGIRSGGHGISGRSTNDGGIVLDVGALDSIEVLDTATRRVRIGPGARWGEVAAALRPYGWALTSGDYGGVGVGGLATAGGIGFLVREHGLTIDHLRAADVVLADGTLVRASDTENPDLFWAVRGAGANVGIVVSFEFEVDEVAEVGFAQLVFDASETAEFLRQWGALAEAAPRDLTPFVILGPPRGGQVVAQMMAVVDSPDPDTIIDRLQPFAQIAPLLQQSVQLVPYTAVVSEPDNVHDGQGEPVTRSGMIEHITDAFAADAERVIRSGATYFFQIRSSGGAVADVDADATAYAHRSANFSVVAFGSSRRRLDAVWDAMSEHFSGIYTSFETDTRPERVGEAFPGRTLERLRELKARYDPDNVFRHNFSVAAPAARVM